MRKRKRASSDSDIPPWMVTFSDLVTLLITFFIVLVSMASLVDTQKRKVALGSVAGAFGKGARNLDDLTTVDTYGFRGTQSGQLWPHCQFSEKNMRWAGATTCCATPGSSR